MDLTFRGDPYHHLGISNKASRDDITKAFRALAKQFHPDINPSDDQAEAKFRTISDAYAILGNIELRRAWDLSQEDQFSDKPHEYAMDIWKEIFETIQRKGT